MRARLPIVFCCASLSVPASSVHAAVRLYEGPSSFASWWAASGSPTTIDFTAFSQGTWITDQSADLGITFISADPDIIVFGDRTFLLDGVGINGLSQVEVSFAAPAFAFGYHHPGIHGIQLWDGNTLTYASPPLGQSGVFDFSAVISTTPFDRAVIVPTSAQGNVSVDTIYVSTVPAPGAIALFVIGALVLGAGRRRTAASSARRRCVSTRQPIAEQKPKPGGLV